jgi:hypothetical protein
MLNQMTKDSFDLKAGEHLLFTENVRLYKNSIVLVVGNNKVVFINSLADIKKAVSVNNETNQFNAEGFLVRVTPSTMAKVYTFHHDFEDFAFDQDDTLESLVKVSEEQEADKNSTISLRGHIKMFSLGNSIDRL